MELTELLEKEGDDIVGTAADALERAKLSSYVQSGTETNYARIAALYELLCESIRHRDLLPMIDYARGVADERFKASFDLQEVQTAFNVLEEVVWKRIASTMDPGQFPESFGMVSTVLGAGKEALATEYVSLASKHTVRSIDLTALFRYGR